MLTSQRVRQIKKATQSSSGPVIYWMSRDQRVDDNWALHEGLELAKKLNTHLEVVFCLRRDLTKSFGTRRMLDFLLGGLKEVHDRLKQLNIPFTLIIGHPEKDIPKFIHSKNSSDLVIELHSLKFHRQWVDKIKSINVNIYQVDAHNIIPVWLTSPKQEWAAYTIRPKIHKLLPTFLTPYPKLHPQSYSGHLPAWHNPEIKVNESITLPNQFVPGSTAALKILHEFKHKQSQYSKNRNDPTKNAISNLSPYLHFGQISSQSVALEISNPDFQEELIVRRELAENFCYYNPNYDNFSGFPDWAQKTLRAHLKDKRPVTYSLEQLEHSKTHDQAWNAAQTQMVKEGKMHGYMRMYWAKKILEWTKDPQTAQRYAIYLNDLYELDGRDPNGYTGIAWSIGGVHDRPWFDRPIIGTIRPMVQTGLQRKFDLQKYIKTYEK